MWLWCIVRNSCKILIFTYRKQTLACQSSATGMKPLRRPAACVEFMCILCAPLTKPRCCVHAQRELIVVCLCVCLSVCVYVSHCYICSMVSKYGLVHEQDHNFLDCNLPDLPKKMLGSRVMAVFAHPISSSPERVNGLMHIQRERETGF